MTGRPILTAEAMRSAEGAAEAGVEELMERAGAALAEARCRSSVCRIELAFESEAARDDGVGALSLPWDSVAVFQVDERDPRNLVIYATRQPEDMRHG